MNARRIRIVFFCLAAALSLCCVSCLPAPGTRDHVTRPPDPAVAALAAPNRLDIALAANPTGWQFSALGSASDKRLPLRILVRAKEPPPTEQAPSQADSSTITLEAALLTETGIGLCSLTATPTDIKVKAILPDGRMETLCERVGMALQRMILTPQPADTDMVLAGTESAAEGLVDPMDHSRKTVLWRQSGWEKTAFAFLPDGPLVEKRIVRDGALQWRASYAEHRAEHSRAGDLYIPRVWRYVETFWNLRMVMLPPDN